MCDLQIWMTSLDDLKWKCRSAWTDLVSVQCLDAPLYWSGYGVRVPRVATPSGCLSGCHMRNSAKVPTLVFLDTSVLHLHYFLRLHFTRFLKVFLWFKIDKISVFTGGTLLKTPVIVSVALENSRGEREREREREQSVSEYGIQVLSLQRWFRALLLPRALLL